MKFHLDFYSIVMIICLVIIFALTVMNKANIFTGLWFYILLIFVFLIMLATFLIYLKKADMAKKGITKKKQI